MPLAIPPELKPITAYIRRSEELDADKSDPQNQNISYYCRTYAMWVVRVHCEIRFIFYFY